MATKTNRRQFLEGTLVSVGALSIVPRRVLGGVGFVAPSDQITAACVGVGSQGFRVMMELLQREEIRIVSVCDCNKGSDDYVEWGNNELRNKVRSLIGDAGWGGDYSGAICGRDPAQQVVDACYARQSPGGAKGCSAYSDFREMLEKENGLDAVVVCTPDHLHAPVSMAAMKKGLHVYCQKPMTHSVFEAREMAKTAAAAGVATQVAIGNSASEATRVLAEWVQAGAVGAVREVHNWSARPFWPQGIDRPSDTPPVPRNLDWNLWLGPAAERPYHPIYQPFVWRGWRDFGAGAIGDMGCYSFDTIFRVLRLSHPASVEASGSCEWVTEGNGTRKKVNTETFPRATRMHFQFPAREEMPGVDIYWYDGGLQPDRPIELPEDRPLLREGMLLVGEEGKILCGFNGERPQILPPERAAAFSAPPQTLPRSPGHYDEWIMACKGEGQAAANFEFSGLVTETILLGNAALWAGKKLNWDGVSFQFTNSPDANNFLSREYRSGWTL